MDRERLTVCGCTLDPEYKPMADDPSRGVFCVRNRSLKQVEEHLGCPFCFGRSRERVEGGERMLFCDWDPECDPVTFGFPPDSARLRRG